ncbi:winged helix-turn-helix transcriptional regulator [Streptomyces sp. NPDC003863]
MPELVHRGVRNVVKERFRSGIRGSRSAGEPGSETRLGPFTAPGSSRARATGSSRTAGGEKSSSRSCGISAPVDKWSVLVTALLGDGPRRHSELRRSVEGISPRMPAPALRSLERDGLVLRTVTPGSPPRVDYALTPVVRTLSAEAGGLIRRAEEHRSRIGRSRRVYDDGAGVRRRRRRRPARVRPRPRAARRRRRLLPGRAAPA